MGDARIYGQVRISSKPDRTWLFELASGQAGYFTAGQARTCGFSRALLSHHVKGGGFVRTRRALYRFRDYPPSEREHVVAAWLSVGKHVAVVSHNSALEILGLSDIIPDVVHLTVPRARRSFPSVPGVRVHTITRPMRREDVITRHGMTVTAPARSILDAAEAGTAPRHIEMAVDRALKDGLVSPERLTLDAGQRVHRVARLIAAAIDKAEEKHPGVAPSATALEQGLLARANLLYVCFGDSGKLPPEA